MNGFFKKAAAIMIGILLLLILIAYLRLPSQPESWSKIEVGMAYDRVYEIEPQFREQGWRDVKGFDLMVVEKNGSRWKLQLYYDADDRVESLKKTLMWGDLEIYESTSD